MKYSLKYLIAPSFDEDALAILKSKKNRILLKVQRPDPGKYREMYKSLLNGVLIQGIDKGNYTEWKEAGGRETTTARKRRS